ncbi:g2681 [Coccomyxa elongata]
MTQEEFSKRLRRWRPTLAEERRRMTWEDAPKCFRDAAELKSGERPKPLEEAVVSGEPPPAGPSLAPEAQRQSGCYLIEQQLGAVLYA